MIARRIRRHHAATEAPRQSINHPRNRQNANPTGWENDGQQVDDDDNDGQIEDEGEDDVAVDDETIRAYNKILYMLNPSAQVELMQYSHRARRNFEMLRIYTLLHQNRANIQLSDNNDSAYDFSTISILLTKAMTKTNNAEVAPSPLYEHSPLDNQESLKSSLITNLPCYTQVLLRTMMLPANLVHSITLFIPLPMLYEERIDRMDLITREVEPNETIVYTLDIIDELLELGGFLMACDEAKIPAPIPHRTWCDWKRSAKPRLTWSDLKDERQNLMNQNQLTITSAPAPSPRDIKNPTLTELRRLVGYSSLLNQYQSTTNIVSILLEQPYGMPRETINKLIQIADFASLCRRCMKTNGIQFDSDVASDIIALADELYWWTKVEWITIY